MPWPNRRIRGSYLVFLCILLRMTDRPEHLLRRGRCAQWWTDAIVGKAGRGIAQGAPHGIGQHQRGFTHGFGIMHALLTVRTLIERYIEFMRQIRRRRDLVVRGAVREQHTSIVP